LNRLVLGKGSRQIWQGLTFMGTPLLRLCYYYIGKARLGQVLNTIVIVVKPFAMPLVPFPYLIASIAYVPVTLHCTVLVFKAYVWLG